MSAIGVWREIFVSAKMPLIYSNSAQCEGGILYFLRQLCTFFALWLRAKLISFHQQRHNGFYLASSF